MAKQKIEDIEVTRGSGNVFKDLGFPDPETHQMKADLVFRLSTIMKERGYNQTKTAKRIGIGQPDLSKLLRGRFRGYSLARLLGFIMALDKDVDIVIRERPNKRKQSRIMVTAA